MVSKTVTFAGAQGFQMETASAFAKEMNEFSAKVTIRFNNGEYNAKSILNIIAAYIRDGSELELICSGDDEVEALARAAWLLEGGLSKQENE